MAQKNKDAIAKRIQEWIIYIALSHPSVRFSFLSLHNSVAGREKTWIKPASSHLLENITMVYGKRLTDMLRVHSIVDVSTKGCDEDTLTITCVLPLASAEPAVVYKGDKVFIYCNARPIKYAKSELKEVVNMIRKRYKEVSGLAYDTKLQTPFMYVDIQTNPNQYDVNIEPNKTAVLFHDQPRIIKLIEALLNECYKVPEQQAPYDMSSYQQKVDTQKDRIITQAPEDSSFTSKIENDEQVVDNTPLQNSPWEFSMLSTISYDSDDSVDELESEPGIELNAMEPNHRVPTLLDWLKGTPVDRKTSHSIIEIQKAPQLIKIGAHQTRETSVPLPEEDWDIGPPQQEPDTPQSYVMSLTMLPEKKDNEKSTKADLPSTQTLKDQMKRNRSNDSREDGMKCSLGALEGLESKRSKLQDSFPNFSVVPPSRDTTTPDTPSRPPLISTTRHRAISSLVGEPVLRSTLHSSKTLGSKRVLHWDYDSVKACYPHRRQRVAHFRQLGLNDYPNISFNKRIENGAMSTPTGSLVHCTPLNSKDLAFYVMYQEVPGMGQYVEQLGVIDLQRAHIIKKFKYLMENCRVVGKTLLDEPVSLEQSQQDPLYSVLLGLEGYEHQVTDNEQSNLPAQYTVITDKRVVNNGFCAQWYKGK
ncbi:hypothetical protein BDF14DRAFT_874800 [Spinellus fusiger]|nr:hypothetical protein BDF14DRAFT_874800 [Spinellus fusiger]